MDKDLSKKEEDVEIIPINHYKVAAGMNPKENYIIVADNLNGKNQHLLLQLQHGDRNRVGVNGLEARDILKLLTDVYRSMVGGDPNEYDNMTLVNLDPAMDWQDIKERRLEGLDEEE